MIFSSWCSSCWTAYHIIGKPDLVRSLLPFTKGQRVKCITEGCKGQAKIDGPGTNDAFTHREIPVMVYYQAMKGLVNVKGVAAPPELVRRLMVGATIADVSLLEIGDPARSIVRTIELDTGVKLHLESSGAGACIYFLEGYDAVDSQRASEVDASARSQDGHGSVVRTESEGQPAADALELSGVPPVQAGNEVPDSGSGSKDTCH